LKALLQDAVHPYAEQLKRTMLTSSPRTPETLESHSKAMLLLHMRWACIIILEWNFISHL